jgi:hypothetical protein
VEGLRDLRRLGLAGSILLGVGALGAGALPMPNPLAGLRLIGLPARNPTISLAIACTGLVIVVVAWARAALRLRAPRPPNRAELVRAAKAKRGRSAAKKGGGGTEIPIRISGVRSHPSFGVDKGRFFKRRGDKS